MRESLIYILYGLILIGGPFLVFFWGRVGIRAYKLSQLRTIRDPNILIPLCIVAHAAGTFLMTLVRIIAFNTFDRLENASATVAYSILLGVLMIVASKVGFIWALSCKRDSPAWKAFCAISAVWIVVVLVSELFW
jgi:hypothetical protein